MAARKPPITIRQNLKVAQPAWIAVDRYFGGLLLPVGIVVVDTVGLGVVLGFEGIEEIADAMLIPQVREEPAVAGDVANQCNCAQ